MSRHGTLLFMTLDEIPLEYMRARKFLAYLTQSVGEQLGWKRVDIAQPDDPLHISVSRTVVQSSEMISGSYSFEYQADLFHRDGWHHHDTDGTCLVTYGNGSTYLRNGFPMIAGVLYLVVGDSRLLPNKRYKRHRGREPITLQQGHYRHGVLLYAMPDGTLALSDEHPFYQMLRPNLLNMIGAHMNTIHYEFPGMTTNGQMAAISEVIYRADLIALITSAVIECVITYTEGAQAPCRPLLTVLSPTIQD